MRITLQRDSYIKEFDANLSVSVMYEVSNKPAEKPQRYVTFEYDSFPRGFVHEIFPAAGFITPRNDVIGGKQGVGRNLSEILIPYLAYFQPKPPITLFTLHFSLFAFALASASAFAFSTISPSSSDT